MVNGVPLRIPPECSGAIADPLFEAFAWLGVDWSIAPGDIAFDVGSSYGVFSTLLALKGATVEAFEANAEVIGAARALAEANGVADRIDVTTNASGTGRVMWNFMSRPVWLASRPAGIGRCLGIMPVRARFVFL